MVYTSTDNSQLLPEWCPQDAIMLVWPDEMTDWASCLDEIRSTYIDMLRAITRFERVLLVCRHTQEAQNIISTQLSAEQMARIIWVEAPYNDTWARDTGPLTLASQGNNTALTLCDYQFNGWGKKFAAHLDTALNATLASQEVFAVPMLDHNDLVLEGGSIETDGDGTVFTTSCCLMAPNRNQPLTEEQIGQRLKDDLGMKRVVFLRHGELQGDDTDGHIDTIVRCAPQSTLLYIKVDDASDPHHDSFEALEQELRDLRTLSGEPYRLLPLPLPDAIYDEDGERLPATYANFLVLNDAVIVPIYQQGAKDQTALRTIAEAFPGRDVIGIDSRVVIRQHGSLHCLSMQLPQGTLSTSI